MAAAGLAVPGFALNLATARYSDFITLIGLFTFSRAATMLAGLETGFGFGGAGAGREALFGIFAEAALLVAVLSLALITGDPTVDGVAQYFYAGQAGISVSLGFALAAMLAVALTETGRIPVDNPAGHLELGMVHEAMLLEYSGRYLALFHYTRVFAADAVVFADRHVVSAVWHGACRGDFVVAGRAAGLGCEALLLCHRTQPAGGFHGQDAGVPGAGIFGRGIVVGPALGDLPVRGRAAERMIEGYAFAHFLGGVILLCAFALLSQRRLAAMISLYQMEAVTLSAAALWQGYVQHSADLFLAAIITFSIKAVVLPFALRRIVHRFNLNRAVETAMPIGVSMILGVLLIGIAVRVVLPATANTVVLTREDLALALSVVLLGLLVMTARRNALSQVIGFLSTENGLVLAAIGMPGMPFVAELSVALLVLIAFLVLGVFVFRVREHFDTLDLTGIEEIERRGR